MLEGLQDFYIDEDNFELYDAYTRIIRHYISAYNELPQVIMDRIMMAKNLSSEKMLEFLELIPYIHSGYMGVLNKKTTSDTKDE